MFFSVFWDWGIWIQLLHLFFYPPRCSQTSHRSEMEYFRDWSSDKRFESSLTFHPHPSRTSEEQKFRRERSRRSFWSRMANWRQVCDRSHLRWRSRRWRGRRAMESFRTNISRWRCSEISPRNQVGHSPVKKCRRNLKKMSEWFNTVKHGWRAHLREKKKMSNSTIWPVGRLVFG